MPSHFAINPAEVVTQPRRFAALSVARRVAEERGEDVGAKSVGCPLGCGILFAAQNA